MSIDQRTHEADASPASAVPAVPAAPPPRKARPVDAAERVASVDVLRGVALLGILAMNVVMFAWPDVVYSTPVRDPGAGALDVALWAFNHVVFDTKMMTLFSMLFGAGVVLMADRAESRGAKARGVYYRRIAWLLVIGLVHAYLIWDGDILVVYALCGFLLYPFRALSPRTLIVTGVGLNLLLIPLLLAARFVAVPYLQTTAARVDAVSRSGTPPHWWDQAVQETWKEIEDAPPKREDFLREIATHRGSYPGLVRDRASKLIWFHTFGMVFGFAWMTGGRMLIGMGLMKLGVFSAACSRNAYLAMTGLGYGIGLPIMAFDTYHQVVNHFFVGRTLEYTLAGWPFLLIYGSLPVVFGHIGAVMLVCRSGAVPWLTRRLAAVGRTALSNYLLTSLFCTTLFYGYGFDLFGTLHRPMLDLIVLAIWTFQLLVSPLWLDAFRFGPAEWLWRSLTYGKRQPFQAGPHAAPS